MEPSTLYSSNNPQQTVQPAYSAPSNIETPSASTEPQTTSPEASSALAWAQTHEISAKTLKALWEITIPMRRGLEEEKERVLVELEKMRKLKEEIDKQQADINKKSLEQDASLNAAMKEKADAEALKNAVDQVRAENKKNEERLKPLLEKGNEITKQIEEARQAQQAAETERKQAETEKAAASADLEQVKTIHNQIQTLQAEFWPKCLSEGQWNDWRRPLQEAAKQDASAALVIAAFHKFCAAEKSPEPQESAMALQDLGSRLYRYTTDADKVAQIATAINETANGRFLLKFARPGDPASDQWMNYQPGLATVRQVRNWAVYKSGPTGAMVIAFKADVQ